MLCLVMAKPAGGAGVAGIEKESVNWLTGNPLISWGCGQLLSHSYTVFLICTNGDNACVGVLSNKT